MDDDALERLETRVETKAGSEPVERRPLRDSGETTAHTWPSSAKATGGKFAIFRFLTKFSVLEMLFIGSILFFIGAAAVASLLFFSGNNTVSTRNVDVSIAGPTSVRAGEEVALQVVITNRNAVPMNLTDLIVEFPPGTRLPTDVSVDLPRIRESLGTIAAGSSVNRTVRAVMFGQAGVPIDVRVAAEYRVPSSNAVFQSESAYRAIISQSPASIGVETLSEVVSGQSTELDITVTSNASEILTGMLLIATYPPGFKFESSSPKPVSGTSVWDLGDIEQKGERHVTIRGIFQGEDGDDRVVHFTTGTKKKTDATTIAAPLAASDTTIKVAKPFVSVALVLKGSHERLVSAERGEIVQVEVEWANNLPVRVQNVEIKVALAGSILDRVSVRTGQGFYRSLDNVVLFNKTTDPRLADIAPGESGVSTFEFRSFPVGSGSFQSPEISLAATVTANRSSEGGVTDTVTSSAQATVQVATDLTLTSVLTRTSGPVPPRVDTETVYSVTWLLQNSANAIANTMVTATLPPYVEWQSSTSGVTYNDNDRTVTWLASDMTANAAKSASFMIAITPSVSQLSSVPVLLNTLKVAAYDRFIRATIEKPQQPVTTGTGSTPQQGIVVP